MWYKRDTAAGRRGTADAREGRWGVVVREASTQKTKTVKESERESEREREKNKEMS
jgi:hypothetical protein